MTARQASLATGRTDAGVTVTSTAHKRFEGWGTSVVGDSRNDPLVVPGALSPRRLRKLDRLAFPIAGINLVRVFGPGYGTKMGHVGAPSAGDRRFAFMRRERKYGVRFMLTGGDAPASMKRGGALAPGMEAPYGRFLANYVKFAQRRGARFAFAALANEPDNSNALLTFSPGQAARAYAELAARLRRDGLRTRLVLGDNTTWPATVRYVSAALASSPIARRSAAIGSHSYGGNAGDRAAAARLARSLGLRVWQTEWGVGCGDCPQDFGMPNAIQWAEQIVTDIVEADATAWFNLRTVGDSKHGALNALIVRQRGSKKRPFYLTTRFYVFRQFSSAGRPGSRRLETRSRGAHLPVLAFKKGRVVSVVLTNPNPVARSVSLDVGRRRGRLHVRRTSSREAFRALRPKRYAGAPIQVVLPARSVTTYILR